MCPRMPQVGGTAKMGTPHNPKIVTGNLLEDQRWRMRHMGSRLSGTWQLLVLTQCSVLGLPRHPRHPHHPRHQDDPQSAFASLGPPSQLSSHQHDAASTSLLSTQLDRTTMVRASLLGVYSSLADVSPYPIEGDSSIRGLEPLRFNSRLGRHGDGLCVRHLRALNSRSAASTNCWLSRIPSPHM